MSFRTRSIIIPVRNFIIIYVVFCIPISLIFSQGSIRSFDVKKLYAGDVFAIAFGQNERFMVSAGADGNIHYWDFFKASELFILKGHRLPVRALKMVGARQIVSAGQDGQIKLWDINRKKEVKTFSENDRVEQSASFATTAAAMTGNENNQGLSRSELKKLKSKEMLSQPSKYSAIGVNSLSESMSNAKANFSSPVNAIDVSADKSLLVSGNVNGIVSVWLLQKGLLKMNLYGHKMSVNAVVFKPNTKLIASASKDKTIIIWDWQHKRKSKVLHGHKGEVTALVYSPTGQFMASGSVDNSIRIWNTKKDSTVVILVGHDNTIRALAFTKNEKYLVSAADDNTIRIWDIFKNHLVCLYQASSYFPRAITISPTENFILSAAKSNVAAIRLWQLNAVIKQYEKDSK